MHAFAAPPAARAPATTRGLHRRRRLGCRIFTRRDARAAEAAAAGVTTAAAGAGASEPPAEADVVVVGGGVAGLAAAAQLQRRGLSTVLLERAEQPGGRVRTDEVDGFLLDHGFQIFLTSYPEAQRALDYTELDLRPFYAGALVRCEDAFHRVADPFRHPLDALASLAPSNAVGDAADKVRVGLLRLRALAGGADAWVAAEPELRIEERLRREGFSAAMVDRFWRPFLGGIFFDTRLNTTDRLLTFVMRALATGSNCLPARGIGAVSRQLAARLAPGTLFTGVRVAAVEEQAGTAVALARLEGGGAVRARRALVVATEGPEAERLLAGTGRLTAAAASAPGAAVGTVCLYFAAAKPPSPEPILFLNGTGAGLVNNCCVPSAVAPAYAPPGQSLISGDAELAAAVRAELSGWFGAEQVAGWRFLRAYRIPYAQPPQAPPTQLRRPVALGGGLFICGDHRDSATLDGALLSGRRAAEAVLSAA